MDSDESTNEYAVSSPRIILGLPTDLWRLALVLGISQLSISIWLWQFSIHLETIIAQWQMGLTFSIGTTAIMIASPVSGFVSDRIGRRSALTVSFIPMTIGLAILHIMPLWPYVAVGYGLINLGWGFVLVLSRAMPADRVSELIDENPVRIFAMVLVPTFILDGTGPLLGGFLLATGNTPLQLYLIAAGITVIALVATIIFVPESLSTHAQSKARSEGVSSFAKLGRPFWIFVVAILGFSFVFRMTMPYYGNLCVNEWGMDTTLYAASWSAFSLTSATLSYSVSGIAGRNKNAAFILAVIGNAVIIGLLSIGSGVLMLFLINILWAAPLVTWQAAESLLVVEGIPEHRHGSALGTFRVVMMSVGLIAAPLGAAIWELTGSLRVLYAIATVISAIWLIVLVILMKVRTRALKQGAPSKTDR